MSGSQTAARYLLLLDSIRQCEGVAKLLQNSSGKEVAVKPAKTNKVTPGGEVFLLLPSTASPVPRAAPRRRLPGDPDTGGHPSRGAHVQHILALILFPF